MFLLVKTIDGHNASYNLIAHIYSRHTQIPYDSFAVGQYGLTNHFVLKDQVSQKSYINITFNALDCEEKCQLLSPQLIIYFLTVTRNMDYLGTLRACPSLIPGRDFQQQ